MCDECIIGTCHWEACQTCAHSDSIGRCMKILEPAIEARGKNLYCTEWEPVE